jgi:hypothetical protein
VLSMDPDSVSDLVSLVAQGSWIGEIRAMQSDWESVARVLHELDSHILQVGEDHLRSAALLRPLVRQEILRARLHGHEGCLDKMREALASAETYLSRVHAQGEDLTLCDLRIQITILKGNTPSSTDINTLIDKGRWTPTLALLTGMVNHSGIS